MELTIRHIIIPCNSTLSQFYNMILYGGLDSLLVASIAARHFAGTKAAKLCEAQLQSFCVGLEVYLLPLMTDNCKLF